MMPVPSLGMASMQNHVLPQSEGTCFSTTTYNLLPSSIIQIPKFGLPVLYNSSLLYFWGQYTDGAYCSEAKK